MRLAKPALKTLMGISLLAISTQSWAQNPDAPPAFHDVQLSHGFATDPSSYAVRAAGAISAARLDDHCQGYITDAPTLALTYEAGSAPLYISGASDNDTTLIVRLPDGSYSCNDDSGEFGTNPGIMLDAPQSGRYAIWLGTLTAGEGYPASMIHISETGYSDSNPFSRTLNTLLAPQASVTLRDGFSEDPYTLQTRAGGEVDASHIEGASCFGYAQEAANLALTYRAGRHPLYIAARGDFDGVLMVRTPTGEWICDDDSARNLNPGIRLDKPESGDYLIWAGTLGERTPQDSEIVISAIGYFANDNSINPGLEPSAGEGRLRDGFSPDPFTLQVEAGGPVDSSSIAEENIDDGDYCGGSFARAPNYRLNYRAGDGALKFSAEADEDTTLAILGPNGRWRCDDDTAGSLNPGLTYDDPQSGDYTVYVGRYSDGEDTLNATLFISQTGYGAEAVSHEITPEAEALYGEINLEPRFLPDPYEVEMPVDGLIEARQAIDDETYCAGYITSQPSIVVNYNGDGQLLYVYTEGTNDTTLAVRRPTGEWLCDDDGAQRANAGLEIKDPQSGRYAIYVGRFSNSDPLRADVRISESEFSRD